MRFKPVDNKIISYIEGLFCDKDANLKDVRDDCPYRPNYSNSEVQISPIEGKFLSLLLKMVKAKRVLEIGTMHGYSSIWLSKSLEDGGVLTTIEKDEDAYKQACNNLSKIHGIDLINEDAKLVLPRFEPQSYDAIFIDGNKAAYPFYLEQATRILKEGGLLLADDALLFIDNWLDCGDKKISSTQNGILKFNDMLSRSDYFESVIVPIFHGIAMGIRNNKV